MNIKRIVVTGTVAALLIGLATTGSALVWMHGKVRALEQERAQLAQKVEEAASALSRRRVGKTPPVKKSPAKKPRVQTDQRLVEYAVKNGDDIVSIAIAVGISPSHLMDINDLKPEDELKSGMTLKIPADKARGLLGFDCREASGQDDTAATNAPSAALGVVNTTYDGETKLRVCLSQRPDMDVIRHYVNVEPLQEGNVSFAYVTEYNYRTKEFDPIVVITGEYAHRTNVTLRVRKGLPPYGKGANPSPEGALEEDYVYTFTRKDRDPYVSFADGGRYLPPGGKRLLKLESVNVGKINTNIMRVEPRNIVQLLAREEGTYSRYEWKRDVDDEETAELAGAGEERKFTCPNRLNEKEFTFLPLKMNDGKATNGVFLVSILNADKARDDYRWNDDYNPCHFRLVCLSDLGLSVRSIGKEGLGVWVTSLMKGTPVGGAQVEVYSKSNTKVMEGVTDAQGWCRPARVDKGEPFAVVVRSAAGDDTTFLALRDSMMVDESYADGARDSFLGEKESTAFCWTDRGIYRHGEKIFVHVITRTGARRAPPQMPVALRLVNPDGNTYATVTKTTDGEGTVAYDGFAVPDDQPSGDWTIVAEIPGKNGRHLGETDVKIEEFAPPQIRVAVDTTTSPDPTNFAFTVKAEHLFGGPAQGLSCEGAVVFEDVPFAPAKWKGWRFGNENLGLRPNFRTLDRSCLAADGSFCYVAPIWADYGLPKAAVRATAQGTVFEDGGRPATARKSAVQHFYPFYIGSTATSSMKLEKGIRPRVSVACVAPGGTRFAGARTLTAQIERVDTVYAYRKKPDGWQAWDCDRVNVLVASNIVVKTSTNENSILEMPLDKAGDYVLTIKDADSTASFALNFYLCDWGDNVVRAPLTNPSEVTVVPDKAHYRVGESPRLTVKAPFAGYALVSVMREKEVYTEVLNLTNATSEVALRPVTADQAPNLDVYVSVVQSVAANARHLAVRAHGQTTVSIRPEENEVPVEIDAKVVGFREVNVDVTAPRATVAVVTVVDEAINLLCGGGTPDPIGYFSEVRGADHPLHDLYHRILPVVGEDELRVNGVKTGGGFGRRGAAGAREPRSHAPVQAARALERARAGGGRQGPRLLQAARVRGGGARDGRRVQRVGGGRGVRAAEGHAKARRDARRPALRGAERRVRGHVADPQPQRRRRHVRLERLDERRDGRGVRDGRAREGRVHEHRRAPDRAEGSGRAGDRLPRGRHGREARKDDPAPGAPRRRVGRDGRRGAGEPVDAADVRALDVQDVRLADRRALPRARMARRLSARLSGADLLAHLPACRCGRHPQHRDAEGQGLRDRRRQARGVDDPSERLRDVARLHLRAMGPRGVALRRALPAGGGEVRRCAEPHCAGTGGGFPAQVGSLNQHGARRLRLPHACARRRARPRPHVQSLRRAEGPLAPLACPAGARIRARI